MQATKALWQGIWNISGARVVKMFLWQACNNILPTKEKLYNKCYTRPVMPSVWTGNGNVSSCLLELHVSKRCLAPVQSENQEMHK